MTAVNASFLGKLKTNFGKIDGVSLESEPPRYWFSTGNAALNKTISGNYEWGIPQGRVTGVAGPSGAGKSFICTNIMREAQSADAFVLTIDTENALDDTFVGAVGVDVKNNYLYTSAVTISQVSRLVSEFIKEYKSSYGTDRDAPRVLIAIDSLDMLLTDTELEHYAKGDTKGDQGQRAKQLKAMLRTFVQDIKNLNISIIVTSQVYQATAQQLLAGEGIWVVNGAVRFALSQLILCTKLKLKDDKTKAISGIRMKCEAFKTRFAAPYQSVTIEVPYETGMDKYNGLFDILKKSGVLEQRGAWYEIPAASVKFKGEDAFAEHAQSVLQYLIEENVALQFERGDGTITADDGDE
jgi:recombination protein RecA